jgi:hypothetical protein
VCCIAAAPAAFAGVDVFVGIGMPQPVFVAQPLAVAYYRHSEPRWHDSRGHFDRRHEYRDHHQNFRRHDRR